ncbi:MAG TPA: DUF885 domain-containing protein [Caulobacterales bacterium]|nr:DUF885 domain-containing protein [Caulobacterales bacterium]
MLSMSRRKALAMLSASALTPAAGCATGVGVSVDAQGRRWLSDWAALNPVAATQLGDHRFDSEIDDVSPAGRAAAGRWRSDVAADLAALRRGSLAPADQVDLALVDNKVQLEAAEDEAESWAWDPLPYNDLAGSALYSLMARDFAPLPERLNHATARMDKLRGMLAQARANLVVERVPRVHADTLAQQNPGLNSIVDDLILSQAAQLGPQDRARLEAAAAALKTAVAEHQHWIETTLVPGAKGDFRIGAASYDKLLPLALGTPLSRAEIKTRAQADIERIRNEMTDIAGRIVTPPANERWTQQRLIEQALERAYADRPARDQVVAQVNRTLREATDYVRNNALITLPDAPVQVIDMPAFQRGVTVAYCDPPGPLDRGQNTFFAVSPIPDDWTDAQATSFLREYNTAEIHELTMHEAMPGHYVQLWHSNRYPSVLRAVLWSGTFVEGWACYAQDMMNEQGYRRDDPHQELINRKMALRVVSNALLDQGVHVDGMSREEAMRLMTETTFQQEREAAGKWIRASVTATQLPTYFVGWSEHHALRREAEQRQGASFNLKRYHDQVLSYGSPPVRLARALMFGEAIPS